MHPLSFDPPTSTLFFVPAFFKARRTGCFFSWRAGIGADKSIVVGTELGDIFWDDGAEDIVRSPVAGVVRRTNRRIVHARLHRDPAQFALVLDP